MTKSEKKQYLNMFLWYRNITLGFVEQLPEQSLDDKLCGHSMTIYCQVVDLGDMQLKILGMMLGKNLLEDTTEVLTGKHTKERLRSYLIHCHERFVHHFLTSNMKGKTLNWYGRFSFDLRGALVFLIAHESLHHGEILSFIYGKNKEMPQAFSQTWGMC
jgi:hypothetical protein